MNKKLLILIGLLLGVEAFAQQSEWSTALHLGLFSFGGVSAQSTSFINYSLSGASGYTNNPYGAQSALSYGASLRYQRITTKRGIFGLELGYETLRSKIAINQLVVSSPSASSVVLVVPGTGVTHLNYRFINAFPHAGYRFRTPQINWDLTGGFDLAYCLGAQEKGKVTADNTTYHTTLERTTIRVDFRPRIQLTAHYNRLGLFVGYAHGLINYKSGYVGGTNETFGRATRFGLLYRIK